MVKCLDALQDLRRLQQKDISWEAAVDSLEEAIEALDVANQHLLRGTFPPPNMVACLSYRCTTAVGRMALTGAIYLSRQAPNRKRVIQGYVLVSKPHHSAVKSITGLIFFSTRDQHMPGATDPPSCGIRMSCSQKLPRTF